MIRPTAHQLVAARRSALNLVLVREDVETFVFEGTHPEHGAFVTIVLGLSPADLLVASVMLPGDRVGAAHVGAVYEIGRSVADLFCARFIGEELGRLTPPQPEAGDLASD